jgi:RNA polymerase sigma factor (sigma-70 family)
MPDPSELRTNELAFWIAALRDGRPGDADRVLQKIVAAFGERARSMLRRFPRAGRFADPDDVVQNCLIRLLTALRTVRPASTEEFYAFANTLIRRELLDLTARSRATGPASLEEDISAPAPGDLEYLAWFHQAVERLPAEEREAVGLTYYHGWTQAQIAELFGVTVRTVQRWLESAKEMLRQADAG